MAELSKVKLLSDLDMVGKERRTWFVVEWKNAEGSGEFAVESEHFPIVAHLNCAESDMVRYALLSPMGVDREEVIGYLSAGNTRLDY
jgi:hypothetical protein